MKPHHLILFYFLISTSTLLPSNCQQQSSEKQILLQIKAAWGNPPTLASWTNSANSDDHCNWSGISCSDNNGFVTEINLPNQNITLPIPDFICRLKNLSRIDLSYNNILGTFPQSLYNCSSLQYLNIAVNNFLGLLPDDIDKLPLNLTYLDLSGNNFTGDIPASIGNLVGLKEVHLEGNLFNGTYPREIGNLFNLEHFSLAGNPFLKPAKIPDEFGNLTKLRILWMTQTNIVGEIPNTLSKLSGLEYFDLAKNQINGTVPIWIWSLRKLLTLELYENELTGEISFTGPIECLNLTELDMSFNKLTGSIPESFGALKNLSLLHMYNNSLSGEIPASIGFLPKLNDIRLFGNNLTGKLPKNLGKYSKLWNLEVFNNRLSGELPPHLCSGNNLVSITMFNNDFSGEIPLSLSNCNTLNVIKLYNNRFSGEFPSKIWSLTNLNEVLIYNNEFSGMLPKELPWDLTYLEISNNRFTGEIPSSAERLRVLRAPNNSFNVELPSNLTGLSTLQELSLGFNQINGSIPESIDGLKSLAILNLSNNMLTGSIPDSIGSLPDLATLDLSNNDLSGQIPVQINNLNNLNFVNVSANNLSGGVPLSLQKQANSRSFLSNPDLCSDFNSNSNLNLSVCQTTMRSSNKLSRALIGIFATLGFVVLVGIGVVGFLLLRARNKRNKSDYNETAWKLTSFHKCDFTEYQIIQGLKEENVIGAGGSGKVYKISLNNVDNHQILAVKRIFVGHKMNDALEKNFNSEVSILGRIRHANIVKLLCCISSTDSKLLVYEYMENSSLDRWLYGQERINGSLPLDWPTRLGIAIDAAKGLCYMHHGYSQPIMHRDIKSSNILLDMKFRAKVADFGLARALEKSGEPETVTAIQGSFGYIAPECGKTKKINEKVDVFSFGVVLLELTTGKRANEGDEYEALSDWALRLYHEHGMLLDMIDEDIRNDDEHIRDIVMVFELGLSCTAKDPIKRPSMKFVLQQLSKCDRMNNTCNGFDCDPYDEAPNLVVLKKGSRGNDFSYRFNEDEDEDEDDTSGSFVVHVS